MSKDFKNKELDKLHKIEIEILDEYVRICKKYNLQYILSEGTLLGAVRHHGFIPWDDDLDVSMPRDDYEKFIKVVTKELDDKYYIDNRNTNEKYYLNFTKLRKKDTLFEQNFQINYDEPKGIWIDIFPIDYVKSENSKLTALQQKLNRLIFSICHYKNGFFISNKLLIIKKIIGKLTIFSNKKLLNWQDKILKWQNNKNYDYFCCLTSSYDYRREIFKKEDIFPIKTLKFEGHEYCVPNNYDSILKKIYGDYMSIPKKEDRITHTPMRLEFEKDCDTNIFVVGHKDFDFPNIVGYKKILVGATNNINKVNGKFDYFDNKNNNISDKNKNYCELTALYWVWKNIKNVEYLGLCHYRRVFSKSKVNENSKLFIRTSFIEKILKEYDIILPEKVRGRKDKKDIYGSFIANSIKPEDLENTRKVLQKEYPEYVDVYDSILKRKKISFTNMFISNKKVFGEYCTWLFDILGDVEKMTNYSNRTDQQLRLFGYISEILLNVWVEKNNLKVKYIKSVKLDEKHNIKYYIKLILEKIRIY